MARQLRCLPVLLVLGALFVAGCGGSANHGFPGAAGEYRWILDRGTPRSTPDGQFAGYIGSCVDISDRKKLEIELREKVRERDDFLSIASHELRTPISVLIGYRDLLAGKKFQLARNKGKVVG